jgi:SAM-dependent methyltransferase
VPQDFVAEKIVQRVRSFPGYPKLRILDLSCGRGEILHRLIEDGCAARGTHFRSDDYKLTEQSGPVYTAALPIDSDVDLLRPLPYPSESFDAVILSEVAEHLATEIPVLSEIGRVLGHGGYLVLSTPNIARLHSRLHFFFTGTHKLIRRRVGWDVSPEALYAYHINPVDFARLHTLLHQAGLRVVSLDFTRFKLRHAWLFLFYPVVWLASRRETRRRVKSEEQRRGERDLFRWMLHPAMLGSEQLLVTARKE